MKKLYFALLLLVSIPLYLRADPPEKLTITYNKENGKLKIIAPHPVKDIQEHYINLISITVNKKVALVVKPKKQTNSKSEIIEVSIPGIAKGSKVTVKAFCNLFGSTVKSISIQ